MHEETVEPYGVRPGTKNFGEKYELVFITHTALQLSLTKNIKNFKVSTNNVSWYDFDDSVFEIEYTNSKKIILAVQLKHTRQNLTLENATANKGDYSLDKYYKSFEEIRKHSSDETKNNYFILYTTGGYSKSIENFHWKKHHLKKSSLMNSEFLPNTQCFQFQCDDSSEKSKFLSRLYICTNQKDCAQTENDIRSLIRSEFEVSLDINDDLLAFMDKWKKGHLGSHFKLSKSEFIGEVCELLLTPHIVKPPFKDENLRFVDLWNRAIECFDVTCVEENPKTASKIWCTIFQKLGLLKVWNENDWTTPCICLTELNLDVPKRYLLNKATNYHISLKNLYLAYWKSGQVPLFLQNGNNSEVFSKILQVLKTTKKTYFVFARSERNAEHFTQFSKFTKLKDLLKSDILKTALETMDINIQSRFHISLEEMAEVDDKILDDVTPDVFLEMMETSSVGVIETYLPQIYIKRRISAPHVDVKLLKYIRGEIIFILCNLNDHFDYILKSFPSRAVEFVGYDINVCTGEKNICVTSYNVSLTTIKKFLSMFNYHKYHIFLMTQKYGTYILKWLQSSSVDLLKEFVSETGNVDNEDDLFSNVNNPINVISSPPGMGKSTLINQMCRTCSQNIWILKIELIEHSNYLRNVTSSAPMDYFQNYYYGKHKLTKVCFDFFRRNRKVVVLFDGFDEISPKFSNTVLEIVETFKSMGLTQWITTRPSAAHIIEKRFALMCHSICPFDSEDKVTFVNAYKTSVGKNFRKTFNAVLISLLKNLDSKFSDNTLQMSMLCETVHSDVSKHSLDFENVDILQLYQKFVDMKFLLFEQKYLKGCDPIVYDDIIQNIRLLNVSNHEICALIAIFGRQASPFVKAQTLKFLDELKQGKEKIGIITQVGPDDVPIFLHQTYAEFFTATWLADNWRTNTRAMKFLERVFLMKVYVMVRVFFDRILARGLELFEAVLEQDFEKVRNCSEDFEQLDDLGRNALHLACSWKVKSTKFVEVLLEKLDPHSGCDRFFNFTPVDWADRTKNIVIIDKILQKNNFDISKLKICANVKWVLSKCINKNCITFLNNFVDYLNTVEKWLPSSDYDNLLFAAIETNDVEIVKALLNIRNFRKHIENEEVHGNAGLQLAILLGHATIAKKIIDVDLNFQPVAKISSYQIAVEESSDDIKQVLKRVNE